jgi:multiple sugar transport system substrate-binding protein
MSDRARAASHRFLSRRSAIRLGLVGAGSALLAACQAAPAPTATPAAKPAAPAAPAPTAAPAAPAPTAAPAKPAAAAPTAAPAAKPAAAPTQAPAAAKPAGTAVSGKIVFMNGIGAHTRLMEPWQNDFNKARAPLTVDAQLVAQGFNEKIQTMVAAGTPPDVFTYYQENIPIVAGVERRLLFAIDDLLKRDNYDISDFLPQAINLNRWQGKLWALPRDYGNQNVYYNVDMFQKKGIPLPGTEWTDGAWTYDKYVEAAKALTDPSEKVWGILLNTAWRPWASFVYSNGGTVVNRNQDGLATDFAIAEDAAVEGLQFLQDLIYKHKVAPGPEATSDLGPVDFFATNKVGMLIGNPSQVVAFRRITAFKWDVAPLPVGRGGKRGTGGGGTGWAMAQATKNPDGAWEFLKFITSEKTQFDEVAAGATTPSRKKVVSSKEFLNPEQSPKNAKSFMQAQEYVVRDPVHVRWPEVQSQVVNKNVELLWGNKADARTVAKTIKEQGDQRFKS